MSGPLSGIKVVELSTFVAGPVTARLLADLGAEVIKVERPEGDTWRITGVNYAPHQYSDAENPAFDIYNSGKKHLSLNLKTAEGMGAFHRLLATADVFITNLRPAALRRLKLSYEDLKDTYPRMVYGIVLGYGENGPDADMPAFDTSAFWARTGFLRDQAYRTEQYTPVQPPFSMGDTVTGYLLMGEICAALFRREKTGCGDLVRSSLFHNGIFTMGNMAIITQKPYGRKLPNERSGWSVPGGAYMCSDGEWIFISGYSTAMYPRIYSILGRDDLAEDPRFADAESRRKNRDVYYQIIRDAFLEKPAAYWLEKAKAADIPMTRMGHYSELGEDPQALANGYIEKVTFSNGNTGLIPRSPIEMESVGELTTKTAPGIGADTRQILGQLGYTAEQIDAMIDSGAAKSTAK